MESKKVPVREDREVEVARRLGVSVGKAKILLDQLYTFERSAKKPCDRCGKPALERGNGLANSCEECRVAMELLGARVSEILRDGPSGDAARNALSFAEFCAGKHKQAIMESHNLIVRAARELGLLGEEAH